MNRNLPSYSEQNILTYKFWNWLQPTFECCGVDDVHSFSVWEDVKGLDSNWKVPDSCCNQDQEDKDCMYEPNIDNAYSEGCSTKILLYAQIVFYGVPTLMLVRWVNSWRNFRIYLDINFSLVFAFIVSASVSSAERRRKAVRSRDPPYNSQYSIGADEDFSHHHNHYPPASAPMQPGGHYSDRDPPFNPGYGDSEVSPYYGGTVMNYPTGTVPPPHSHVPLLHQAPPRWVMKVFFFTPNGKLKELHETLYNFLKFIPGLQGTDFDGTFKYVD